MKIAVAVLFCLVFLMVGISAGRFNVQSSLTREVNLEQVAVKGQNGFRAQVLILYKDGKLDSIELVSGTTVPVPVLKK